MNQSDIEKRAELKAQLKRIRSDVFLEVDSLGARMNVVQRVQNTVRNNKTAWILGSVAAGIGVSYFYGKGKKSGKKSGSASAVKSGLIKTLFLGLLGSATKQILRESAPGLINMAKAGMMQWMGSMQETLDPSEDVPDLPKDSFRDE